MQATERRLLPAVRCTAMAAALFLGGFVLAQTAPPSSHALVNDVVISGNRMVPTQEVTGPMKTRAGLEFNPDVLQEDVRNLNNTQKFGNVEARIRTENDGKVTVFIYIRDFPTRVEEVIYLGAKHLSDEVLTDLTGIRKGAPLNPVANKLGCQAIARKLQDDGRPFARCELLSGDKLGDTKVVFNITEGPIVRVAGIEFVGNTFVSGAVLNTHVDTSKKFLGLNLGGKINQAMIDSDLGKLETYYKTFGFLDVRVSRVLRYLPDGNDVVVEFHIEEGIRYRVMEAPKVTNVRAFPPVELEQLEKVKPGTYYSQNDIDRDLDAIKTYIGNRGREAKAQAIPIYSRDVPGLLTVNYEVEEKEPARVGEIKIVGNERTKENVIRRQIPLYPGQVLTYPDLRLAERNLQRLNIFASGQDGSDKPTLVVLDPDSPNMFKDILVKVKEDNTGSLLFGVGVNSDAGLTGSIVLNERNFDVFRPPTSIEDLLSGNAWRGAGQEFRIEAVPGTELQRYSVSLREPYLFDSLFSFGISGYYYERQYNEYTEERIGARATIGRKLNQWWSVNAAVRVENVNVSNVSVLAPEDYTSVVGNHFQVGTSIGVTYDSRDSYMRATEGSLVSATFEEVFGDHDFPLVNIEANKFFTIWQRADGSGRQVLAARSQLSIAGSDTPVYERFFAGGFRSMRGFEFRGVGPDFNGYKLGGDFMWLNSLEYQIPILANDQVYAVTFIDSGTVESRVDLNNYRVAAGFGLRFVVPMFGPVPIALDFGFPIVKTSADNSQVFSFWLGFFR